MKIRIGFVSVVSRGVRESREREQEIFSGKSNCPWGSNLRVDANPDDDALDVWLDENDVPRVKWHVKWDKSEGVFESTRNPLKLNYEGPLTPMDIVRLDLLHRTHGCDPVLKAARDSEDSRQHTVEVWAELDGVESNHLFYKVS